ncbi:ATP-binding protein [Glaciimonas sp. PCH181]|uniref:ATP-binding protein n=1 Tax=Glaciimonas sp. PCH181 TaxID=2133943 RepID=UPI000D33DB8A|nr:ATP-binding protein [Glaciimonas sp. PCH181]PUA18674.1 sensor histidine kinase [Glaciimonas sp. PCH181]
MSFKKSTVLLVSGIGFIIAVVFATYVLAAIKATNDSREAGEAQLQIIALDLESVLEKFETLPFALGYQADVEQALTHPDDPVVIQRLNLTLQAIQRQSKVVAIYMQDRNGMTLASSNWDQPFSFVGKDFRFRPYFLEAIKGRAGRFYGIGNATNQPGYFIAQPVYPSGAVHGSVAPIGIMTVKIDLAEFEDTWRSSESPITLTDQSGVVFLSNRPAWKYHSLQPLDNAVQNDMSGTLQYANQTITPVAALPKATQAGFGAHLTRPIGRLGWQLMLFPSQARVQRVASLWTLAVSLLMGTACATLWAMYQRRRRLQERLESRNALQRAAVELEQKIVQRTQELQLANQNLEIKYVKLKETEHLLRSTQNELVQAGKLAMLGQMAAGVTHELNQPLAAIRAFADNAVTFLARGQATQAGENLAHISAASARMGTIIGQLKGFARKSHETVAVVDLAQAINASAALLQNEFKQHAVHLDIEIRESLQVIGDTVRVEQVLINLLHNAIDAVATVERKSICVSLEREENTAVIRIRDFGPGIPEQVAQHLFAPFFTTKPSGKGLGLGLAISSSIVQAMDGQLTANNHSDGGAEFLLRLPLLQIMES